MERNKFQNITMEINTFIQKILLDKNSSKRSFVHCWCNLVAVLCGQPALMIKKFLIFQGGQWFVDQLWERWNQWVKNGSQWSSNYNLSSLEINGPSPPAEEDLFSPSSSKQETVGSSNEYLLFFKIGIRKGIINLM